MCSVAKDHIQKHRGIKHSAKVTNDGYNNDKSAENTAHTPLTEASSNDPIFNTVVQNGSWPHEAAFGRHYTTSRNSLLKDLTR